MAKQFDVLVVGAGAAGLMTAKDLSEAGYSVCILEATEKAGGRIATRLVDDFDIPLETGAEFIHGTAPLTIELLKEAGIDYQEDHRTMRVVQNGVWQGEEGNGERFAIATRQLNEAKEDMPLHQFLDKYLPAKEFEDARKSIQQFSEGFDLADPTRASLFALREEWNNINDVQHIIPGGYQQLIDYLLTACQNKSVTIRFSSPVYRIAHQNGIIITSTSDGQQFRSTRIVITASIGMLQGGNLRFLPPISAQENAIRKLGFGSVIKFFIQFREAFWMDRTNNEDGFFISDERIPTWWTDHHHCLATGWLGGPRATSASNLYENELHEMAISSLARIFSMEFNTLRDMVVHHKVICWDKQLFVKGGYTYQTVQSAEALALLSEPVNDQIYFAGEAFYDGEFSGTVEAALVSGKETASRIAANLHF